MAGGLKGKGICSRTVKVLLPFDEQFLSETTGREGEEGTFVVVLRIRYVSDYLAESFL